MAEAHEKSGLAQSIDALFSQLAPSEASANAERAEEDVDGSAVAAESSGGTESPGGPGASSGDETSGEPLPGPEVLLPSDRLDASEAALSAGEVSEAIDLPAPGEEVSVLASKEAPVLAESADDAEGDDAKVDDAEVAVVEAEAEGQAEAEEPTEAVEPVEVASAELARAVEAFLQGEPAAAEDMRSVAARLRDRLALDPLADAVERLVQGNGGPVPEDRVAMALEVMDPAVASRLVQRMGHVEDDERRAGYIELSKRLGLVMARAFRGALTDATESRARRVYYDALIAMGETSRPLIEAMVEDDNRFLVRNAVAMLGEIGGDRARELVTSALADTDPRVRREALSSLAKLGGEDAGPLVMGSLDDPDQDVRAAAAEAAGTLHLTRALRPVLALLADEDDPDALVLILRGLGRLGDPGAVQAIEKRAAGSMFSKPPTEVRVAAYRALHAIGTPYARQLIDKAREDKDPVVRTTARALVEAD